MKKLLIIHILSLISSFGFANYMAPILVVKGQDMPETEVEIVKKYHQADGSPIPVIFKGGALNWPAMKWTPDYLSNHFGDKNVHGGSDYYNLLKDFLIEAEKNTQHAPYLKLYGNSPINITHTDCNEQRDHCDNHNEFCFDEGLAFSKNARFPTIYPRPTYQDGCTYYPTIRSLVGPKGTHSLFHSHYKAFLAQVYGKKRVFLVDPKQAVEFFTLLEAYHKKDYHYVTDFRCLEGTDIHVFEGIIETGDVVYIPDDWLHDVKALTPSFTLHYE